MGLSIHDKGERAHACVLFFSTTPSDMKDRFVIMHDGVSAIKTDARQKGRASIIWAQKTIGLMNGARLPSAS